ncbi:TniQ family protein [Comamonas guangdongensis]|uniref:TniQ family protein n=1 Tax=Comamonas guangdongensis TaxID=510515 RepID=A0ABV4A1Y3_9BURK
MLEDESGLGFCLRSVAMNGGRLSALHRLLGMGASERLKAVHAPRLAQWFGVDKARLAHRLPAILPRSMGARRACYGHLFRQPGVLRTNQPQVCPQCIHEKGYLLDVWDLTLSTCCLEHGLCLTGRCPQCQAAIKWDRKGVQWGGCRHHLGSTDKAVLAAPELLCAQRILQASLRLTQCAGDTGVPAWITGLSLDGWMQVFYAFGLLRSSWSPLCPRELSRCLAPAEAQEVVKRALGRLQAFTGMPKHGGAWASVVARAPLIGLITCPTGRRDQAIGRQLFQQIFGQKEMDIVVRRYPELGQLNLFDEAAA